MKKTKAINYAAVFIDRLAEVSESGSLFAVAMSTEYAEAALLSAAIFGGEYDLAVAMPAIYVDESLPGRQFIIRAI